MCYEQIFGNHEQWPINQIRKKKIISEVIDVYSEDSLVRDI